MNRFAVAGAICLILIAVVCAPASCLDETPAKIYISPGYVGLCAGMQQQFTVFGVDINGDEVPVPGPVNWSTDPLAGTVTPTGLFTAARTSALFHQGIVVTAPGGLVATAVVEGLASIPQSGLMLVKSFGSSMRGRLNYATGIAIDPVGNTYVADTYDHRVQKFDPSGELLMQWGSYGSGNGQFNEPRGIALDSLGNVYVTDTQNSRVQKFSPAGQYVTQWGASGSGIGQFSQPWAVAVHPNGVIYVLDRSNNRVALFGPTGSFINQWGSRGAADGQFNYPEGIVVDADGYVYISDTNSHRIQKFSSSGQFLTKWGSQGNGAGQFLYPAGLATDSARNLYVTDKSNGRIQKFNSSGSFLLAIGSYGFGGGKLNNSAAVTVDAVGNVYVSDRENFLVQKFDAAGTYQSQWGGIGETNGNFRRPYGLTKGADGSLYVADAYNHICQKLDASEGYVNKFGILTVPGDGGLAWPSSIDVDIAGNAVVCDGNVFKKYDASGNYISKFGAGGSSDGQFSNPGAFTRDGSGNYYVADTHNNRVQKFSANWTLLTKWGVSGNADGEFSYPRGIAVSAGGSVYVADTLNHRIQVFNSWGGYLNQWGSYGSEPGQFNRPGRIAVSPVGFVYVTDIGNRRIQKFDASGSYVSQISVPEIVPEDLAFDTSGNLFVSDTATNRIYKFAPAVAVDTSLKSLSDGAFVTVSGHCVTAGSEDFGDCFYMQKTDRTSGIRVTGASAARGQSVGVTGVLVTVNGEREIQATTLTTAPGSSPPPVGMSNKAIGGGDLNYNMMTGAGQQGVEDGVGLNNIGLLVTVWGAYTKITDTSFILDDGSGAKIKCVVSSGANLNPLWSYAVVTGISSCEEVGDELHPLVRVRDQNDIAPLQ